MTSFNEQLLYKKNRRNPKFKDYNKEDLENHIESLQKSLSKLHILNDTNRFNGTLEPVVQDKQNMLGEIVKEYKVRFDKGEFQYTGEISKDEWL